MILLSLVAFGCSGGGEKPAAVKTQEKAPVREAAPAPAPEAKAPEAKKVRQAKPANPYLNLNAEEFRARFNKSSELVKSKLRMGKIKYELGAEQSIFKQVFTDNLSLTGRVNNANGLILEIVLAGAMNGSLASNVDINMGVGTIVTVFTPDLSHKERAAILMGLGISDKNRGIYNLDRKVTQNGITFWVKSSGKEGLRFGVKKA